MLMEHDTANDVILNLNGYQLIIFELHYTISVATFVGRYLKELLLTTYAYALFD